MFFKSLFPFILLFIGHFNWMHAEYLFEFDAGSEGVFWTKIDLLCWKPREKSLVLTNKKSPVFFTDDFTQAKVIHPHFDWDFGYRIGLGYLFPCYPWDIALDWTHYHTTVHQQRSTDSNDLTNVENQEGMFPIWALAPDIISGDYVSDANLNWKLSLNLIDLEFGYFTAFGNCFEIRPYAGIRAAWIRQHAYIHYQGGIFLIGIIQGGVSLNGTDHVHMKNDFWGVGPRIGIEPRLILGNGFSLYGDAAISGLCGEFSINQQETYLETERFSHHKRMVRFRCVADLAAGVSWRTFLCEQKYSLTFQLGWEYHLFFHQLELKRNAFHLVPHNRNLDVQGITFSGRFDF